MKWLEIISPSNSGFDFIRINKIFKTEINKTGEIGLP